MFYRIAAVTLESQIELPSYAAFRCEPAKADVTLEAAREALPEGGEDIIREPIAVQKIGSGWLYHGPTQSGLTVSEDYTKLRLLRQREGKLNFIEEWYIRIALECLLIHRG